MFRLLATTTAAASLAMPVFAEGVTFARLSYTYAERDAESSSFDLETNLFQGAIEYEVSRFLLSADVLDQEFENGFGVVWTDQLYNLSAAYKITPEVLAGFGVLRYEGSPDDPVNGFEAFGQYQAADFALGLNITQQDVDSDNITTTAFGDLVVAEGVTIGLSVVAQSEFEETGSRISVDYALGPVTARAFVTGDSYNNGGRYGVRGSYAFTPQIRVSAGYAASYGDDFRESYTYRVGAGYQIVDGLWFDANYGQRDVDFDPLDGEFVQAMLSYEIGNQTRIDRRFRQAAIDDAQASFNTFAF